MKQRFIRQLVSGALIFQTLFSTSTRILAQSYVESLESSNQSFTETVDPQYGYELAKKLGEFRTHEELGYRTAGSNAEREAGEFLYEEMRSIGLDNVRKEKFTLDGWTFEKAQLNFKDAEGQNYSSLLGGYQVNFDTEVEKEFDIVYLNKGTEKDYEDVDVDGKLVLVDINQREEWWINYPAYEAKLHGAAALIAVQEASFSEISPDALNANDLIGPADTPVFSMSQTDAQVLKDSLEANDNQLTVTFDAKSTVEEGSATAQNILGEIEGKDPDSYIVLSAHYDAYFEGFQDNSTAVGMMLGIAKALIEMDYQPEKTIVFMAVAAEEWGATNTRYDWSTGAYNQLFNLTPEWQEQALFNINFEIPGIEHDETHYVMTVRELETFMNQFIQTVPDFDGNAYANGLAVSAPVNTWADDFSFAIAGIPSTRNSFDEGDFGVTTYHTQFDDIQTHNEAAYEHNHILYGLMTLYYDHTAVLPLDFTTTMTALDESIAKMNMSHEGIDTQPMIEYIQQITEDAAKMNQTIVQMNTDYMTALNQGDTEAASAIYKEAQTINQELKQAFRLIQDEFTKLTWEDEPQFGHEIVSSNLDNLYAGLEALESNNITSALDDYLWAVDNNWYAYSFSKETFDYFNQYVLDQADNRLFWGAGRVVGHVDLFDTIESLQAKIEEDDADLTNEMTDLNSAIEKQTDLLQQLIADETDALAQLADLTTSIVNSINDAQ
ncbi:M28 family peptidase [Aerococcaceae bacterium WGS1372]